MIEVPIDTVVRHALHVCVDDQGLNEQEFETLFSMVVVAEKNGQNVPEIIHSFLRFKPK